jgi:hypothetical protein
MGFLQVTAGHDSYFNESFPVVFDLNMKPVLATLGVEARAAGRGRGAAHHDDRYLGACEQLDTDNLAMGNNPVIPAMTCIEAATGPSLPLRAHAYGLRHAPRLLQATPTLSFGSWA